jgi:adenylate cyclase
MNDRWQLRVYDGDRTYIAELTGAAEIGRQQHKDETQPAHVKTGERWRVVIAPLQEVTISRKHLEVEPQTDGRFLISNKSANQVVGLPDGKELAAGASCVLPLPIVLRIGNKALRLQAGEEEPTLTSLPQATVAPGSTSVSTPSLPATLAGQTGPAMAADQLTAWVQAFLGLLQSAAGSEDFYAQAARALVDLVKLDSGRVLFYSVPPSPSGRGAGGEGSWRVDVVHAGPNLIPQLDWRPSSRVLASLLRDKKTFWQVPDTRAGASMQGVNAVVAAPILDRNGNVIGALYGERRQADQAQRPISQLEASLVDVLASGVAAGLARVEQERTAQRAQLQMEQFFGRRLAAKLVEHPELLDGRDTAVSVLFCDIRGFSRITERLGPARTVEWISDVLGVLSQCVLDEEGVIVDYVGDEVMAMWGAPEEQADHAARACRAALAMLARLPKLNERWQPTVQEPVGFSIGVNSGNARVGNVGSKIKFKYGALGNAVNLGSRVQGATKHLKADLLITGATQAALDTSFLTRRLCQVRVVNIAQPVTLFELAPPGKPRWPDLKAGYEQALDEFTRGDFRHACQTLGRLIRDHADDGPALLLLSRAVGCLVEAPTPFDPVMVLEGK